MAVDVVVPELGESIKQAVLLRWHKEDGATVAMDEPLCELETDKANTDVPSPAAGKFKRLIEIGKTVDVGQVIGRVDAANGAASAVKAPAKAAPAAKAPAPAAAKKAAPTPPPAPAPVAKAPLPPPLPVAPAPSAKAPALAYDEKGVAHVELTKIRKRIGQRLVAAQHTAAILTTFNEVDMQAIQEMRTRYKDRFTETYGVGLGLISFFARATVLALRDFPVVNAFLDNDEITYHRYVHLGLAVSTERGLAVPVLRNVETMSFARIESEVKRVATAVREGKLSIEELSGGTFTITNGGIFGSLLSTPILNPPQSGILGMHTIQKRAVVINDKIEIRPMMYVALSYDHRVVDGRESVGFLVRLKQLLEEPARLMLEI